HICLGILMALFMAATGCDLGSSSSGSGVYTISGTITAPGNTAIDSDVNEINTIPKANDTFETAQVLKKNPVILGGYVNIPEHGEEGNSYENGDMADVFKIALTKNETVNLYIAEYETADLDLYLYDSNQDIVAPLSPPGNDAIEKVQAPLAGAYFVEVKAVSGASNYILTMGQGITEATIMDTRLEDDFMPGDIVVKLRPEAQGSFGHSLRTFSDDFMGLRHTSGSFEDEIVLKIDAENRQQVFRQLNIPLPETNRQLFEADEPDVQLKLDTLRTIDALKKCPEVMIAEPNYIRHALEVPNDEYYPLQWHYPLIHLPQAWEITEMNPETEVIVAVIDTGLLFTPPGKHPDIDEDRIVDGYDFISKPSISLDGDGIDPNPQDPGDEMEGGSSFHGTHVAGTIGAATNNEIGVAGIARNCKIMPLRVLGNGGGLASDIREAIKYAAGLPNSSGIELPPSRRADIVNMSLGGSSPSDLDKQVIAAARDAGVIIIAAAGNYASNAPMYPAAYDEVISVSAVGADKQLAPYSNHGSTIDIAAPGGNMSQDYDGDGHLDGVLSTSGDDESGSIQMVYHFSQGTSMAAPHVAGVVALMKSLYPALTPAMLDAWITDHVNQPLVEDLGPVGHDNSYGYGLIDAFQAIITAQKAETGEFPTFLYVSPLSLNFGTDNDSLELTAENFGNTDMGDVTIAEVEDEPWLSITEEIDDGKQHWTYTVTVDRDGLPDGPYAATIILESDVNIVEVSVSMQKGIPTGGDAGYHYVLLLDPDTFVTIAQFDVAAPVNGVYPFSLQALPGEYILFAGTDSDNDYTVGDPGESAGAYISMDQPRVIRLNRDRSGFNFTTSFNLNLPTTLTGEEDGYGFHVQREGGLPIDKP
ncbi:MAG: S8 family serine peptidase, partial [Thermodesulfobacteriota bacterium]